MSKFRFLEQAETLLQKEKFEDWIGAVDYIALGCVEYLPKTSKSYKKYINLKNQVKTEKITVVVNKHKTVKKIEFEQILIKGVNNKEILKKYLQDALEEIKNELME